jgi:pyridoxamine 5'-phosphate oxidase-like protein
MPLSGAVVGQDASETHRASLISWQELEAAAPTIAQLGRQRLEATRLALLGTLQKDGSPRISPVEPYLRQGELLFGAMARSAKTRDLLRDPRCVVHSAIVGPDIGEAELKLYGRAVKASPESRARCAEGWWQARPASAAVVFAVSIARASLVVWDLGQGQMTVRRSSAAGGLSEECRNYP